MFYNSIPLIKPRVALPLDGGFCPAILWNHAFLDAVRSSGKELPLAVGLERNDGGVSIFRTQVFSPKHKLASTNLLYVERLIKTLLWLQGGHKLIIENRYENSFSKRL